MRLAAKRLRKGITARAIKEHETMERHFATVAVSDIKGWLYHRSMIDYNENIGATLSEIVESVKDKGVIEPIICRKLDTGDIQGIAGYLRFLACQKLDIKEISAIVYSGLGDLEATDILLTENLERQEMADVDVANVLGFYVKAGIKQQDIAIRIHRSESYVSQYLALLKDTEPIRKALSEKTEAFTEKHAREVRKLPERLHKKAIEAVKGKTVKEAKTVIEQLTTENKAVMIRAQIKELETQIKEIDEAEKQKLEVERQISEIEAKIKALMPTSNDIRRLIGKIEVIRVGYFPRKQMLAELTSRRTELLKTVPNFDISPLQKERDEVNERIAKKEERIKAIKEELRGLQDETKKLQEEEKRLTGRIELAVKAKNELSRIESEISELGKGIADLEKRFSEEIKNYDKLVGTIQNSEKELLAQRNAMFESVAKLKEQARSLNGKIANRKLAEKRLTSLKEELKSLKA